MPFSSVPSTPTAVLGDDLIRVVKLLHHVRQQAPRQHPQVDPMAYPLLFNLKVAPMRVSALAEVLHSDVSTVSRQVSTLVDLGFVVRGPDPDDGRAQALSLTDEGSALLTAIREDRDRWLTGPARRLVRRRRHRVLRAPAPLRLRPRGLPPLPHPKERPMNDSTPPATPGAALATGGGAPAPAAVDEPDRPTGPLTHRQIVTILIGLMMGMFLAALDQTIVATAIRTIADDLNGLNHQAWATTAYLITSTIVTPLYGKLSDIYGRKQLFIIAISIFIVGSIAVHASPTSMYSLAAFRAVQGLGAGGLFSLALAIIGDIVPPRERAKYQGYFLAVFGTVVACSARSSAASSPARRPSSASTAGAGSSSSTCRSASPRWPSSAKTLHLRAQPPRPPHRLGRRRAALRRRSCRCCSSPSRAASGAGTQPVAIACYVIGVARRRSASSGRSGG